MFFRVTLASLFVTIFTSVVSAHGECASISDSDQRLSCFDEAHHTELVVEEEKPSENRDEVPEEPEPVPVKVDWSTRTKTNPLTDLTDVFLSVTANETIQCGYETERPMLFLRCQDNTTTAFMVTDCFMSDVQGYGSVRYRVDKQSEKKRNFKSSTDNMALGLWSYNRSRPFIDHLQSGDKLIMQYTPYNDSPVLSTFDISGLEQALKPLRKECGW